MIFFIIFLSFYLTEVAEICYEKYSALKHKYGITDEEFTVEKMLENIHYVSVTGVLELIATVKHLEYLFQENKTVIQCSTIFELFFV